MAKLGIDSSAYANMATGSPPPWTTPEWVEADGISDFTENTDWDRSEIIIRRSLVKHNAKTVVDLDVSCKILREPDNPVYMRIRDALRTRAPIDMLFLDASIETAGAEGFRYMAQVTKGGGSQNTGDTLFRDIVFTPFPDGDATHVPQWADVEVAGTVVLTPITPEESALMRAARKGQISLEELTAKLKANRVERLATHAVTKQDK